MLTVGYLPESQQQMTGCCDCSQQPVPMSGCRCCSGTEPSPSLADNLTVPQQADKYCRNQVGDDPYTVGTCNTWYLANEHANKDFPGSNWNPIRWTGLLLHQSYTYPDVQKVIQTYIGAVQQGAVPEYGRPSDTNRQQSNETIKKLAPFLPHYEENFIRVVMYELEQGVKNSIVAPTLLWPVSLSDPNTPPVELNAYLARYQDSIKAKAQEEAKPDILEQIGNGLKTAAVLGVIGLVVWGGVKVYTATRK